MIALSASATFISMKRRPDFAFSYASKFPRDQNLPLDHAALSKSCQTKHYNYKIQKMPMKRATHGHMSDRLRGLRPREAALVAVGSNCSGVEDVAVPFEEPPVGPVAEDILAGSTRVFDPEESVELAPAELASVEVVPAELAPAEPAPTEPASAPVEVAPAEPAPTPAEVAPAEVAPVEPAPAPVPAPAEVAPVEPAPAPAEAEVAPVEPVPAPAPAPAEVAPAEVAPAEPTPAELGPELFTTELPPDEAVPATLGADGADVWLPAFVDCPTGLTPVLAAEGAEVAVEAAAVADETSVLVDRGRELAVVAGELLACVIGAADVVRVCAVPLPEADPPTPSKKLKMSQKSRNCWKGAGSVIQLPLKHSV